MTMITHPFFKRGVAMTDGPFSFQRQLSITNGRWQAMATLCARDREVQPLEPELVLHAELEVLAAREVHYQQSVSSDFCVGVRHRPVEANPLVPDVVQLAFDLHPGLQLRTPVSAFEREAAAGKGRDVSMAIPSSASEGKGEFDHKLALCPFEKGRGSSTMAVPLLMKGCVRVSSFEEGAL
jgi:hypothetical protein